MMTRLVVTLALLGIGASAAASTEQAAKNNDATQSTTKDEEEDDEKRRVVYNLNADAAVGSGTGEGYTFWDIDVWHSGTQSKSESFKDCMCWNSTSDNWCHHEKDGPNTGFWRDSCQRVLAYDVRWLLGIVFWCLYLVCMPIFVCAFRLCCDCCGGRTPSFGCCCPISNKVLSPDPKWVRPYSRCATWTAKVLAVIVLAACVSCGIHSYLHNNQVSQDLETGALNFEGMLSRIESHMDDIVAMGKTYTVVGSQYNWWKVDSSKVKKKVDHATRQLNSISSQLRDTHRRQLRYRAEPTVVVLGACMGPILLVTLLGLCNVRSWAISCCAGLISFITVAVVVCAAGTMSLTEALKLVCDSTDNLAVVTNFTKDIFTTEGYCNGEELTHGINETQFRYAQYLCGHLGLEKYISDRVQKSGSTPHHGNSSSSSRDGGGSSTTGSNELNFCDQVVGGMYTVDNPVFLGLAVVNGPELAQNLTYNPWQAAVEGQSLVNCALNTSCTKNAEVGTILSTIHNLFESKSHNTVGIQYLFEMNYECNIVDYEMARVVEPSLCGTRPHMDQHLVAYSSASDEVMVPPIEIIEQTEKLAIYLFALAGVATVGFWVWLNGSKRFTKSASEAELMGHQDQLTSYFQHPASYHRQQALAGINSYGAVTAHNAATTVQGVSNNDDDSSVQSFGSGFVLPVAPFYTDQHNQQASSDPGRSRRSHLTDPSQARLDDEACVSQPLLGGGEGLSQGHVVAVDAQHIVADVDDSGDSNKAASPPSTTPP